MSTDYNFVSRTTVINQMISGKNPKDVDMKQLRIFFDSVVKKDTPFLETGKQDFKEVMGKVLDLTKNPGTHSLAKLWYFIVQGDRRDARARAVEIIINHSTSQIKGNAAAWNHIKNILSSRVDTIDALLLKALLAKYKPHGLYKIDLQQLDESQLKNLYVLTDELDLTIVPKSIIEKEGFLVGLLEAAQQKKDYEMMKSIFRATEKTSTLDKTIELQDALVKTPSLDTAYKLSRSYKSQKAQGGTSEKLKRKAQKKDILNLRADVLAHIAEKQAGPTSEDQGDSSQ